MEQALTIIRRRSPYFFCAAVGTWALAWATGHRRQRGRKGCLFACGPILVDPQAHGRTCTAARRELALAAGVAIDDRVLSIVGLAPPQAP